MKIEKVSWGLAHKFFPEFTRQLDSEQRPGLSGLFSDTIKEFDRVGFAVLSLDPSEIPDTDLSFFAKGFASRLTHKLTERGHGYFDISTRIIKEEEQSYILLINDGLTDEDILKTLKGIFTSE